MWLEWQLHAARGYVVFFCNPRGSDGYGDDFRTKIHDNWGEADMNDILSGVDAVVAQGYIDETRMAVTGGSYGGFMTAWVIGHDQRFAAAVSQRGVYQMMSFYGTTDVPRLIEGEFDTMAFDDPEKMWKYSPFAYVRQMHTPLLLIHSDNDFRVPISDAEQLFTALKKLRRTVEFVRYPRDGHELSRSGEPKHRIDRLERITAWFDKYCKPRKLKGE
jgi:dipeptidyl aminopeptidase/acylaminoacyl peptidase